MPRTGSHPQHDPGSPAFLLGQLAGALAPGLEQLRNAVVGGSRGGNACALGDPDGGLPRGDGGVYEDIPGKDALRGYYPDDGGAGPGVRAQPPHAADATGDLAGHPCWNVR